MPRVTAGLIGYKLPYIKNNSRKCIKNFIKYKTWKYINQFDPTHCLVTADWPIGLWMAAVIKDAGIPYTIVKPDLDDRYIGPPAHIRKINYYVNHAAQCITVESKGADQEDNIYENFKEMGDWASNKHTSLRKTVWDKMEILLRNQWIIDHSDKILIATHNPKAVVGRWTQHYAYSFDREVQSLIYADKKVTDLDEIPF